MTALNSHIRFPKGPQWSRASGVQFATAPNGTCWVLHDGTGTVCPGFGRARWPINSQKPMNTMKAIKVTNYPWADGKERIPCATMVNAVSVFGSPNEYLESQYGRVTYREWCEREVDRCKDKADLNVYEDDNGYVCFGRWSAKAPDHIAALPRSEKEKARLLAIHNQRPERKLITA